MRTTRESPIRIAFFHIMAGNFSGAGKNIFRLLRRIDLRRLKPILVGQKDNELTNRTRQLEIDVYIIPYPPALNVYDRKLLNLTIIDLLRTISGAWKYNITLVRFFKKTKPEVVWADNIRTFLFIYAACKISGCKIIWNIWSEPKGKLAWVLYRLGLTLADVVNLEYKGQAAKLFGGLASLKFLQDKLVTLYTGVTDFEELTGNNVRNELNLSSEDILIIMASNISPAKGQLDLLHAMDLLVREFPHLHLLLAGRPPDTHLDSVVYDATLRKYALERALSRNVHFLGWRSDVPDLLQASDIYVSTSYGEALADSLREAMAAAKSMVVTDVGGTSELVAKGRCAFLFEPGDVQALVRYLTDLIRDSKLRAAMGLEGKRIIESNFSTEAYARKFEDMVSAVIR